MSKVMNARCLLCQTRSEIFDSLKTDELERVETCRVSMHYNPGEIIFKQGSPCHDFVCVTSGLVKLYIEGEHDRKLIVGFAKPVDYIFVPGAYVDKRHHFTAIACEDTTACLVSSEVIQELVKTNNAFANSFITKISMQAIDMFSQISSLAQKQIPGRMAGTLLHLSKGVYQANPFTSFLTRQDLADMSGMTKESAIRALKSFKEDGLVAIDGNVIELLNIPMLETISRNG
ncbi:MAG: Crp/Fnr family transcriptional regulator [Lentimicrobiaceae bacterium]|nr:Crp/Fnr family transcriptional regulator [Lentimicrobiaceae bacterium]